MWGDGRGYGSSAQDRAHMAASSQVILLHEEPTKQGEKTKLNYIQIGLHWAGKFSSLLLEGMERHKCFVS